MKRCEVTITTRPFDYMDIATPCIFMPILGTCFFAFQYNLGTFLSLQVVNVSLNLDALKLNWVIDIVIYT
jgi:hypothetical protein